MANDIFRHIQLIYNHNVDYDDDLFFFLVNFSKRTRSFHAYLSDNICIYYIYDFIFISPPQPTVFCCTRALMLLNSVIGFNIYFSFVVGYLNV